MLDSAIWLTAMLWGVGDPLGPGERSERVDGTGWRPRAVRQEEDPHPRRLDVRAPERAGATLALEAEARAWTMRGWTRVREWDRVPATLDLHEDLGLDAAGGLEVRGRLGLGGIELSLEIEMYSVAGSGRRDADFNYDEGRFRKDLPFSTHGSMVFVRPLLHLPGLFHHDATTSVGLLAGVEYARISLGIEQPLANDESSEQYSQFLPYPVAGLEASHVFFGAIALSARVLLGGSPEVATPFEEGGTLFMEARRLQVELRLRWQASAGLALTVSLGASAWSGRLHSVEDDNELEIAGATASVGFDLRW